MLAHLCDGNALMYRSILMPEGMTEMRSPSGEPTGGVFSFTSTILKLIRTRNPTHFAIAMDAPRHELMRRKWYDGYKRRRSVSQDESFYAQFRRCEEVVTTLGLPVIRCKGWEGDDILATLATMFSDAGGTALVVGTDKDLHQVVGPRVRMLDPYKMEETTARQVEERWGVPPNKVVQVQALAGDPTDKVPGVVGIGPANALELIKRFGTAKEAKRQRHLLPPRQETALAKADIKMCLRLVRLKKNLDLGVTLDDLAFRKLDLERARPLFQELGFKRLVLPQSNPHEDKTSRGRTRRLAPRPLL